VPAGLDVALRDAKSAVDILEHMTTRGVQVEPSRQKTPEVQESHERLLGGVMSAEIVSRTHRQEL
jgi:hypothetical protein